MVHYEGKMVTIRTWKHSDRVPLARIANNPHIAQNMMNSFPSPYSLDDADSWIGRCQSLDEGLEQHFAIEQNGKLAGGIGFFSGADIHYRTAYLGYWVAEDFWGRGIATDAVGAILKCIFKEEQFNRSMAGIFASNPASIRVLEKNGFSKEGTLRSSIYKNKTYYDEVLMGLLRIDYEKHKVETKAK